MAIPLEDNVSDIIGKAQRGLGLDDQALADRMKIPLDQLEGVKKVAGVEPALVRKLAEALGLGGLALTRLAEGKYEPFAKPPTAGFFMANTPYGDVHVNAYLIWDTRSGLAAAFDTGADAAPLIDEIKANNLTLQDIYLTHTHADHVMELDRLREPFVGSIGVHVAEAEAGVIPDAAAFAPGVTFSLGRLNIETRDTSGHSAGGVSYHIHGLDAPLVIVGDALFAGSVGGIGSDYKAALKRIRDNILSGQDNTNIAPGHGPMTTVKAEKENNPFFPEFRRTVAQGI